MDKKRSTGRPVNTAAGTALKAAALRLLRENAYDKVSIAAIIKEANVARQTLYNRWDTKADLVLEAVFEQTHAYAAEPVLEAGQSCRWVLERFLMDVFNHLNAEGDIVRALIAAAQQDKAFHDTFYANFVLPREQMIIALLQKAQETGDFAPSRDPELVSASIHGIFWYRLLNQQVLDDKLAKDIAREVFDHRAE